MRARQLFALWICGACLLCAAPLLAQELEPDWPEPEEEEGEAKPVQQREVEASLTEQERKMFRAHERTPLEDAVQWRAGFLMMGLANSQQGSPGIYPTLGVRYRGEQVYVDMQLPALFAALDFGQYLIQRELIGVNQPFDLFRTINKPEQYSFLEVMHVRVGKIFKGDGEWSFAVGGVLFADFVVFDAMFGDEEIPADSRDFTDFLSADPFVLGPGGFIAGLKNWDGGSVEIAFEVGRDLLNFGSYVPVEGWIFSLDVDLQVKLSEDWAAFGRMRTSYYSHLQGRYPITAAMVFGVTFRL